LLSDANHKARDKVQSLNSLDDVPLQLNKKMSLNLADKVILRNLFRNGCNSYSDVKDAINSIRYLPLNSHSFYDYSEDEGITIPAKIGVWDRFYLVFPSKKVEEDYLKNWVKSNFHQFPSPFLANELSLGRYSVDALKELFEVNHIINSLVLANNLNLLKNCIDYIRVYGSPLGYRTEDGDFVVYQLS